MAVSPQESKYSAHVSPDKPLRIVRLGGGLGNQMFQYAFGLAAGDVLWDNTSFLTNHYRSFDLGLYNISGDFASNEQIKKCKNEIRFKNILPRSIRKKFNLGKFIYLKTNRVCERQINRYEPELLNKDGDVYYDGVFQTEKYFKPLRERLLHDFTLTKPLDAANLDMLAKIRAADAVAVHIRRGDYLNPRSPFTYLDKDYFLNAMDYIGKRVDKPHFFIFSSDTDWVRTNIQTAYPQTIVEINDEKHGYFDLELMRNCRHNIIANSTFSWWGAWLNTNPDKIVVAPKQWFRPDAAEYSGDIVPNDWIKL